MQTACRHAATFAVFARPMARRCSVLVHLKRPDSMNLVRYQPEHQPAMLALHRSAMEGFATGMASHEEEADLVAIEQVYLLPGGEFLIGLVDGQVAAMGGFERLSDTTAELRRMRIERQLQGQGYGSQLLCELERLAYGQGVRTLTLDTARARPLTLEFYHKHGYAEIGQSRYGQVETVQFSKELRPRTLNPDG
jgi:GNAT superfamily N-acetyltransferase